MRPFSLALLLTCALRLGAQVGDATHPVVLISIDGLKPEYVLHADRYGLKIPNLRALVARGAHASGVVGVVPTVTYPSHTTLVTGVAPARHGIITNSTFDPLNRNQGGWYWYASDLRVPTLWDAVMDSGRTTGNVHWPVTVGAHITWNLPQFWRTGELDDRKLVRALSTQGLYDALEREVVSRTLERAGADDKPSAWRAAIWSGGASAAIILKDPTDVATRDRVSQLLRSLAADSGNGIDRVIDSTELHRRGGFPGAAFLVNLRDGYTFGYNSRGPLVASVPVGGMHGYLPDSPAMRAAFIIAGPGIPAARDLGVIDQRAVAPTLARVLGVRLSNAEAEALLP